MAHNSLFISLLKVKCCYCGPQHNTQHTAPATTKIRHFSTMHTTGRERERASEILFTSQFAFHAIAPLACPRPLRIGGHNQPASQQRHPTLRGCRPTEHCEIVKSCGSLSEEHSLGDSVLVAGGWWASESNKPFDRNRIRKSVFH